MTRLGPIRVVVAEDSPTARYLLVSLLAADPAIEVVAETGDGRSAFDLTLALRPDLVLMDIRMPIMDGFEATRLIMSEVPTPVIIVTAAGATDVELSLQAIALGALTLLPKPTAPNAPGFAADAARLVSLVKALADVKVVRRRRPRNSGDLSGSTRSDARHRDPISVVAVAASTGGPAALHRFLEHLPAKVDFPILVVQHIADGFTKGLVSWLSGATDLRVKIAEQGEPIVPGSVYVASEDHHLEVSPTRTVSLSNAPPVGGFRPSATVLLASVARAYGRTAVAVVLTGMGRDGCEGAAALKQAGGLVLAQDEATSVVFGMPGVVVAEGLADVVGPVELLAAQLATVTPGTQRTRGRA